MKFIRAACIWVSFILAIMLYAAIGCHRSGWYGLLWSEHPVPRDIAPALTVQDDTGYPWLHGITPDGETYRGAHGLFAIEVEDGEIHISRVSAPTTPSPGTKRASPPKWALGWETNECHLLISIQGRLNWGSRDREIVADVRVSTRRLRVDGAGCYVQGETLHIPGLVLALLAGLPAEFWLLWKPVLFLRWRKIRRLRRQGLCTHCGYDLRCSRDRCPECGHSFFRADDNKNASQRAAAAARSLREHIEGRTN